MPNRPTIELRTESDLTAEAIANIYAASNGLLNAQSGSALLNFIKAMSFICAEAIYYENQILEAIEVYWLRLLGIQRKLGSFAVVSLTFTLTQPLTTTFEIRGGYLVSDASNAYGFTTDGILRIPAGAISGTISATALELGANYNVPVGAIVNLSEAQAFLASVSNAQAATGGADEETIEEASIRGFTALRRRQLVSGDDFEEDSKAFLGEGATAKCLGKLNDKFSQEKGWVHIFALNADGSQPNTAELKDLQTYLSDPAKLQVGISVACSAISLMPLDLVADCHLLEGSDPQAIADTIHTNLKAYLTPDKLTVGKSILIKEIEYVVRNSGVAWVDSVAQQTASGLAFTNITVPNLWTAGFLLGLVINLVDSDGYPYQYIYSDGVDLD